MSETPAERIDVELLSGRRFRLTTSPHGRRAGSFIGDWPAGEAQPFVDAVYFGSEGVPGERNFERAFFFEGSHSEPHAPTMAARVVSFDTSYRRSYVQELLAVELLPGGEIEDDRLRPPDPQVLEQRLQVNGGTPTEIHVQDFRTAAAGATPVQARQSPPETVSDRAELSGRGDADRSDKARPHVVGLILAGIVAIVLLCIIVVAVRRNIL